jgi:hypothetical protein
MNINALQFKLQEILKTIEKSNVNDFKQGNINSLIKSGSDQMDAGDYSEAINELTQALTELNDYAMDLMKGSTRTVENRYEKKDKDKK